MRCLLLFRQNPAENELAQLFLQLRASEDGDDALQGLGIGGLHTVDVRMGQGAPHEDGVQHSHQLDVVYVVPLAGDQPRVFTPLDAGAEDLGGHRVLLVNGIDGALGLASGAAPEGPALGGSDIRARRLCGPTRRGWPTLQAVRHPAW